MGPKVLSRLAALGAMLLCGIEKHACATATVTLAEQPTTLTAEQIPRLKISIDSGPNPWNNLNLNNNPRNFQFAIVSDRAGGLIWRYKDAADFYFVSIFLEVREAALIRVTAGNRITLDRARDIDLDPEAWHNLTVVHNGDQILAQVDGIAVLRGRDRMLTEGGRAGVWSAGNSTVAFDDLTIEDKPE